MAITITEKVVKNAVAPASGSVLIWDECGGGFGLRVHARGTKSFFFNYRFGGVEKRLTIGKYPAWSALQARNRARELRQLIDRGIDPTAEKRERASAPTVQDLIDRYVRERVEANGQSRPADVRRMLQEAAHIIGAGTKVADVHYGDIERMHRMISQGYAGKEPRPVRANRTLSTLSAAFTLSLRPLAGENRSWRDQAMGNPCKGVAKNREEEKGRLYSNDELERISDAIMAYTGREEVRDYVRLIMLTGCRPIEAQRATWDQFDREAGWWIKPASVTKQRKEHPAPLNDPTRQLIQELRAKRKGDGQIVFPGKGKNGTVTATHCIWTFIRERAGLDAEARIYDLRHSFASIAAANGIPLLVIGKLLGHSQSRTTERYSRHFSDPLRDASDKVAAQITGGKRTLRVVGGNET